MSPGNQQQSASAAVSYGEAVQECPLAKKKQKSWIGIQLIGEDDQPVAGVAYRITFPDGTTKDGVLDENGSARADNIDPGSCVITFPELDQDAWEPL